MNSSASLRYVGFPILVVSNLYYSHSPGISFRSLLTIFPPYFSPTHTRTHAFSGASAFFFSFFFLSSPEELLSLNGLKKIYIISSY